MQCSIRGGRVQGGSRASSLKCRGAVAGALELDVMDTMDELDAINRWATRVNNREIDYESAVELFHRAGEGSIDVDVQGREIDLDEC